MPINCCPNSNIIEENGFKVCINCGYVHAIIYDDAPRRMFNEEQVKKRRRNEIVYNYVGPRTLIDHYKDGFGHLLYPKEKAKFMRLSKIHKSIASSSERNKLIALRILNKLVKDLKLPKYIIKDTEKFYDRVLTFGISRGRSIDILMSACLYIIIRKNNIIINHDKITEVACIDKKRYYKTLKAIYFNKLARSKPISSEDYIKNFICKLNLSIKCLKIALELFQKAIDDGYNRSGKNPKAIAAACVYIANIILDEKKLTQVNIAIIAGITEVTFRKKIEEFDKYTSIEISKNMKKKRKKEYSFF